MVQKNLDRQMFETSSARSACECELNCFMKLNKTLYVVRTLTFFAKSLLLSAKELQNVPENDKLTQRMQVERSTKAFIYFITNCHMYKCF